jgi:dTDP-4-dehydrorhamnose reductase
MSKILVLGKGGQLSNALLALLGNRAIVAGPEEADFMEAGFTDKLEAFVGNQPITAVINAAAYTQVDLSETNGLEASFRINATAVAELAQWVKTRGFPIVHFSSDYVFNGSGEKPWNEQDQPDPLNAYGKSKILGEVLLSQYSGPYLIFRTSWLYDASGKNFFSTIRRLLGEKPELNVVADQIGAPTYVPHLAAAVLAVLDKALSANEFPSGTYHMCSSGETSWYGFANAIFEHEKAKKPELTCQKISPIPSSAYPLPAKRPLNSRLDCSRVKNTFGIAMPDWSEGLKDCFKAG